MVNFESVRSERGLRTLINRNLKKEIHPGTKPSMEFIVKIVNDAYESGLHYDIRDLYTKILIFATGSTHHAEYCMKLMDKIHFHSDDISENREKDSDLVIFDCEVFPNLFMVKWKIYGKNNPIISFINPTPEQIETLLEYRLVGFNCRHYDNHMLYGRLMGYSEYDLYKLSKRIIEGDRNAFFAEAYNLSYTDIYDFSSVKQSLKKFEIDLGIFHKELDIPWDEPVPEELWQKVSEYCDNDVLATEAVFDARADDFTARKILADIAGMTVNDTTNSLTARIIFGREKNPQSRFSYRNMADTSNGVERYVTTKEGLIFDKYGDEFTVFDKEDRPVFPGYVFDHGKSTYRDIEVGEGGYVYAEPGLYRNVALLDIASMHPSSIIAENLFGEYTKRFEELRNARVLIKHKKYDEAKKMLDGKLAKYLDDKSNAKSLSKALKIPINAVYGLTSAKFDNPFKDRRNVDNIVAKRGALFMINLQHVVQEKGYTVAHIKTDSIKIPDATPEIIDYVVNYGKQYGYSFEHEATYDRMCLVNDAVYIAKYASVEKCRELYGDEYVDSSNDILADNKEDGAVWTATGTQFQVPYVFKSLFSKEDIQFEDLCTTSAVSTALYLDMNEKLGENEHDYHFVGKVGRFCPMISGSGGGILLRENKDHPIAEDGGSAVSGSKGYRFMESEMVKNLEKESEIDRSYFDKLSEKAREAIEEHGDFTIFTEQ